MSILVTLLVIILIVAVVYWVAGLVGLPSPMPQLIAVFALLLLILERGSLHL